MKPTWDDSDNGRSNLYNTVCRTDASTANSVRTSSIGDIAMSVIELISLVDKYAFAN